LDGAGGDRVGAMGAASLSLGLDNFDFDVWHQDIPEGLAVIQQRRERIRAYLSAADNPAFRIENCGNRSLSRWNKNKQKF